MPETGPACSSASARHSSRDARSRHMNAEVSRPGWIQFTIEEDSEIQVLTGKPEEILIRRLANAGNDLISMGSKFNDQRRKACIGQ